MSLTKIEKNEMEVDENVVEMSSDESDIEITFFHDSRKQVKELLGDSGGSTNHQNSHYIPSDTPVDEAGPSSSTKTERLPETSDNDMSQNNELRAESEANKKKVRQMIILRNKLYERAKVLGEREINFDDDDEEESLVMEEIHVQQVILRLEKRICKVCANDNSKEMLEIIKCAYLPSIVIDNSGNPNIDKKLTELIAAKRGPCIPIISHDEVKQICESVRNEEMATGNGSEVPSPRDEYLFPSFVTHLTALISKTIRNVAYNEDLKHYSEVLPNEETSGTKIEAENGGHALSKVLKIISEGGIENIMNEETEDLIDEVCLVSDEDCMDEEEVDDESEGEEDEEIEEIEEIGEGTAGEEGIEQTVQQKVEGGTGENRIGKGIAEKDVEEGTAAEIGGELAEGKEEDILHERTQDKAIQNQPVPNQPVQNETIQNEPVQNETIRKDTVQNETIQNGTVEDVTVQDGTIQNEPVQMAAPGVTVQKEAPDKTIQNEPVQKAVEDEIIQNEPVQDETVQKEAVQRDADQDEATQNETVQKAAQNVVAEIAERERSIETEILDDVALAKIQKENEAGQSSQVFFNVSDMIKKKIVENEDEEDDIRIDCVIEKPRKNVSCVTGDQKFEGVQIWLRSNDFMSNPNPSEHETFQEPLAKKQRRDGLISLHETPISEESTASLCEQNTELCSNDDDSSDSLEIICCIPSAPQISSARKKVVSPSPSSIEVVEEVRPTFSKKDSVSNTTPTKKPDASEDEKGALDCDISNQDSNEILIISSTPAHPKPIVNNVAKNVGGAGGGNSKTMVIVNKKKSFQTTEKSSSSPIKNNSVPLTTEPSDPNLPYGCRNVSLSFSPVHHDRVSQAVPPTVPEEDIIILD